MVKITGTTPVSKEAIHKAAQAKPADKASKKQVTKRGDQAPEAKTSTKAKSAAADKMFKDADNVSRAGFPPGLTQAQQDAIVRKAALGY